MPFSKQNRSHTLNGLLFVTLFALSSLYLGEFPWLAKLGISPLIIAIILGIIYSNTLRHKLPDEWTPGIQFAAKRLLRLAIILYGFRVTIQQISAVGMEGFLLDLAVVTGTLIVGIWLGIKLFKLDKQLAILISIGSAICGAAAVLAAEDILKSEPYKAAAAIGTVVLFGTLGMFLYPFLFQTGWFNLSETQYGLFAGASIHEVAQVVVAGNNVSPDASNIAVVVKMTRVLLLIPVLILLSFYVSRTTKTKTNKHNSKITIPWFAFGFILMIGINSLNLIPQFIVNIINQFDIFLLTMAMAAIGIETSFAKLKKVGLKPLNLAIALFIWLTGSVYLAVTLT